MRSVYNQQEGRLHAVLGTEHTHVYKTHRSNDCKSQARKAEGGFGEGGGGGEGAVYPWGEGRPT